MEMDTNALRLTIRSAREELEETESKCDALRRYIDGQQAMLDFLLSQDSEGNGIISVRDAVCNVLRGFPGSPMSSREIASHIDWDSTRSKAKSRESAVDGAVHGLIDRGEPIEKAGPRMWAWKANPEQPTTAPPDLLETAESEKYPPG